MMNREMKVVMVDEGEVVRTIEVDGEEVQARVPCAQVEVVSMDGDSGVMLRFPGKSAEMCKDEGIEPGATVQVSVVVE